ncbi:cysteine-rich CWC family protein [Leptospira sarikeiensis]|uniref:Cysteine-rich CWC family protein n=1 Tax=Leptospira sarikeiensis TaxID=2484943 RepID=A0A4R9K5U7_9LEPT|nr:cysteine-rich CWC family protein [Leptospira sarikeiensis]TGL60903.1 hypothetical protein EHQ64_13925 [Leptospira sarikeiensis]
MTQKKCTRCSKIFGCGVDEGSCWCFEIKLDSIALNNIREMYTDCLCKDCLTTFETNVVNHIEE